MCSIFDSILKFDYYIHLTGGPYINTFISHFLQQGVNNAEKFDYVSGI